MEQAMAVQTAAAPQTSLRAMFGMGQGQVQGDAFAMIFQQLMAGDADQLADLLAQMSGNIQDEAEDMGTKLAAEMLAMMPGMPIQVQDLATMLQSDSAVAQNTVELLSATMNTPQGRTQLPAILSQLEGLSQTAAEETEEDPLPELAPADRDFVELLSAAWKEDDSLPKAAPSTTVTLDHAAIRAAKELLQRGRKGTTETLDVESLQADVNARRYLPAEALSQKQELPVPDAEEIARQLKASILDNVSRGKNEFVVRLKPEGIGEIMVKLSENREKITLSIFTNNSQTARLISGEIAALQNALKPLNAEVQEITTVAANQQASQYSAQNQMTDQGRQFFGQQPSHEGSGSHRGGFGGSQEDGFEDTVEAGLATDDILNTYI